MSAHLHASLILATILVPVVVICFDHGQKSRGLRHVVVLLLPFLVIGGLAQLILSARGAAFSEWLFPLIGTLLIGLFVKNDLTLKIACVSLFVMAATLSVHSEYVKNELGYTMRPSAETQIWQKSEAGLKTILADELLRVYPGNRSFLPGAVKPMLEGRTSLSPLETDSFHVDFEREWFTSFTGLHKIVRVPGEIWYPGGPIVQGAKKLEWRAKPTS